MIYFNDGLPLTPSFNPTPTVIHIHSHHVSKPSQADQILSIQRLHSYHAIPKITYLFWKHSASHLATPLASLYVAHFASMYWWLLHNIPCTCLWYMTERREDVSLSFFTPMLIISSITQMNLLLVCRHTHLSSCSQAYKKSPLSTYIQSFPSLHFTQKHYRCNYFHSSFYIAQPQQVLLIEIIIIWWTLTTMSW